MMDIGADDGAAFEHGLAQSVGTAVHLGTHLRWDGRGVGATDRSALERLLVAKRGLGDERFPTDHSRSYSCQPLSRSGEYKALGRPPPFAETKRRNQCNPTKF